MQTYRDTNARARAHTFRDARDVAVVAQMHVHRCTDSRGCTCAHMLRCRQQTHAEVAWTHDMDADASD